MSRYRSLVRFRLPIPSTEWSELHWCYFELTADGIKAYIAPINQNGMPSDKEFQPLDPEQAKKLLVIDFPDAQKPKQPGAPLLACREEQISKYCLVLKNHTMYKFHFDIHSNLLMKLGQIWIEDRKFDNSKETISTIFNAEELAIDSRLQMRTSAPYNHDLLNIETTVLAAKHKQFRDWQQKLIREQEAAIIAEQQRQLAIQAQQQFEQAEYERWQGMRSVPVVIEISRFQNSMDDLDQVNLHARICESLSDIKSNTDNQALYSAVLYQMMNQTKTPEEYSAELKAAIRRFREDFLTNGGTLMQLFADEASTHPTFSTVYNYVLDVVFAELQIYDSSFVGASANTYKKPCSQSDANVRLGVARTETLLGLVADEEEDANLAAVLQLQELGLYGARNLDMQQNGNPEPQRALGTRHDLSASDAEIAQRMQQEEYFNQPPVNYGGGRHSPLMFRPAGERRPPNPPQLHNNLALILGAALATYAIYLAVTSSFSWLVLGVVIGISVVTAVSLQRNRPAEAGNNPRFGF